MTLRSLLSRSEPSLAAQGAALPEDAPAVETATAATTARGATSSSTLAHSAFAKLKRIASRNTVNAAVDLPAHPGTRKDFLNQGSSQSLVLQQWIKTGSGDRDNRQEAVDRIRFFAGTRNECLRLASLGLTSLPPALPVEIRHLNLRSNRFVGIPDGIPPDLRCLDLAFNELTKVPDTTGTGLGSDCVVILDGNPLHLDAGAALEKIRHDERGSGPMFSFSMPQSGQKNAENEPRNTKDAVAAWRSDDAELSAGWATFNDEIFSDEFVKFLNYLNRVPGFESEKFDAVVNEWLAALAQHPALRENCFMQSIESTTTCPDKVLYTFNRMTAARLLHDVESGVHDADLPKLIDVARGLFRLEKLENIARLKVASLTKFDEIEVYLAYQVKLRELLALPLHVDSMQYFASSMVSERDLKDAELHVKTLESREFPQYLSEWLPWQQAMQRLGEAPSQPFTEFESEFSLVLANDEIAENEVLRRDLVELIASDESSERSDDRADVASQRSWSTNEDHQATVAFLRRHQASQLTNSPW